jgi:hypothetical protein
MKIRFGILTLLALTTAIAIWLSSLDQYGELEMGVSRSSIGNRYFVVTYVWRPARWGNVPPKFELGILQSELNAWPPDLEFEFDPAGKFKVKGIEPPQHPVLVLKFGDKRIVIPSDCQLHEIWDGEHTSMDGKLQYEEFQRFVDSANQFPRLSQLPKYLEETDSN